MGFARKLRARFERGVDTANIIKALDRAAKLLEDMGACKVCPGIIDNYPLPQLPKQIEFVPEKINQYLGVNVEQTKMVDILKRLEFQVDVQADKIQVVVPTWRGDVTYPSDISEEIARIYGYDNIPSTAPVGKVVRGEQNYAQSLVDLTKDHLTGIGFSEIMAFSFTHPSVFDKLNMPENDPAQKPLSRF